MEKENSGLLTITEAAAYLNVSKATIRRWTNNGELSCVRIGARGERRFRQADLAAFISASVAAADEPQHAAQEHTRHAADEHARHHCVVSKNTEEEWAELGPRIVTALKQGAQVFVVEDAGRRKHLKRLLDDHGFDLNALIAAHQLRCVSVDDSYLLSGEMRAERAIAYFESVILEAKARGIEDILIIGNSSWVGDCSNNPGLLEQVSEYEDSLDHLAARFSGAEIICPYAATHVDSHLMVQAFAKHKAITVGTGAGF